MAPDVSIVLLTSNGLGTLPGVLAAIDAQESPLRREIVAIDSGSTDGTVEYLRSRVDRLLQIPAATFNHGETRNAAIVESRGALVVLLVQDAVPDSPRWLDNLVRPLLADDRLAGTYARQQPRADASAITRYYLARWLAASPTPRTSYVASREAFDRLAPYDRFTACVFDNVCSCVRRSVWTRHPFKATPIAEDLEWARDVLLAGHGLAYVPEAVVIHSHDRSGALRADADVSGAPAAARAVRAGDDPGRAEPAARLGVDGAAAPAVRDERLAAPARRRACSGAP